MRRIHTLTITLAILALGAMTASASPLVDQRYAELKQACSPEDHPYAGKSEADIKAALAKTSDRVYKLDLAQCEENRVAAAGQPEDEDANADDSNVRPTPANYRNNRGGYGPARYRADEVLDSLGPNGKVKQHIRSPKQLGRAEQECGRMVVARGVRGFAVSHRCLAERRGRSYR